MKIFQLTHRHIFEDGSFEDKGIGYFRTESDCYKAIDFLLSKPGFCDLPKGFHIDELSLETNQDEKISMQCTKSPVTLLMTGRMFRCWVFLRMSKLHNPWQILGPNV